VPERHRPAKARCGARCGHLPRNLRLLSLRGRAAPAVWTSPPSANPSACSSSTMWCLARRATAAIVSDGLTPSAVGMAVADLRAEVGDRPGLLAAQQPPAR
jgi:hypothetical protein